MSIHTLRRLNLLPRLILAGWLLVFGVTAASPCLYGASSCPDMSMSDCANARNAGVDDNDPSCGTFAGIDCQASQDSRDTPTQANFDLTHPTPAVLASLPAAIAAADSDCARRHRLAALDVPRPPLNLQHARLLI